MYVACMHFSRATTTYISNSINLKELIVSKNPCEMSAFSLKSQVAGPMRKYGDELATCVKGTDLDLDYLVQKAKIIQHVKLAELLEKVVELHQKLSTKVPPHTALKECEDEFMTHLRRTDLEGLANEAKQGFRFLNADELLSRIADIYNIYRTQDDSKDLCTKKLAACMKAINFDLDALIANAKKFQQRKLKELLEKIKELSNAYKKMSTKEPLKDRTLNEYENKFFNYLKLYYSEGLAEEVKQLRYVNVDKLLTKMQHTESDEVVIKIQDGLAVCLNTFDYDLAFYVKTRKLSEEVMKLVNVHQEFCMKSKDQSEYDGRFIACLQDLTGLVRLGRGFRLVDVDTLLLNLADAKQTYEEDYKKILLSAMKALEHYERQFIARLQEDSVTVLVQDAYKAKLIPKKVKSILVSMHYDVPFQLRCRYLMLYVYKEIAKDHLFFDKWLDLLYRYKGISGVLGNVSLYYSRLIRVPLEENMVIDDCSGDKDHFDPDFYFNDKHVSTLTEILTAHSSLWREIAISLGLPHNEISSIESMMHVYKVIGCLNEVLHVWVVQKYDYAKPPTLKYLETALRGETVGLGAEASILQEKLTERGIVPSGDECSIQVTEDERVFKILDQTEETKVLEVDGYLLFGVDVSSSTNSTLKYQWYKDGKELNDDSTQYYGSKESIISICIDTLTVEGSYTCKIQQGDKSIDSKNIILTIETPLDQYMKKLKDFYTAKPEVPGDTWPPVSIDTYINLALIKQQGIDNAGEYARCTIRGDADDVFKDKEKIEYESIFDRLGSGARLLIEGRPGSGKTTLVHKVSKDWAKGELRFDQVKLLFLVHLRGFLSDPNIKLRNILECHFNDDSDSAVDDITKYAHKHNGLGLCFILDGLDEYLPKKKDTFIHKLIDKSELPRAFVIVASRPVAVADFRSSATRQIEVLGFLKEQITEYVKEYNFSDESKCSELLKYLDHHPNVHHMCYLPIHTAMACYLCQVDRTLPETETGIYKEFTIYFFLRALRQLNDDEYIYIDSIESLPSPQRESYMKICKLAFEMTLSSKQVMKHDDVRDFDVHSNRDYLGLITVDKVALKYGFQKLYTFLHLTFQEFLAAYYISELEEVEQTKLVNEYGNAKQMQIVWKFYCGFVKFDDCNKFRRLVSNTQTGTLYKVQCSFESQQSITCDSIVEDSSLSFKDKFLTPSDFTAIAFVISHASQGISKLVFDECTLGQEGIDVLNKKAKDKLSQVTTLCFHGHDCAAEQLKAVSILMHALPFLKILDLTGTQLGEDAVKAITSDLNHSNLQVLKIDTADNNPLYSSNGLLQLLVKSFESKCSNFVNFWFPDCSKKHLFSLRFYFYSNIYLRDINMSSCHLRPIEINIISNDLKVRLVCSRLSLINCGITDEGAKTLSDAIRSSNIKILELSMNSIGNEGALALANSIESCFILQTVDLSCNQIGDDGALAIVRAIPLKARLFLWSNVISKHGAETLLQIKQDVDLNSLHINSRSIGDSGAKAIFSGLKNQNVRENLRFYNFGCLHTLRLCTNLIGIDGAKALANALEACTCLISLDLSNNEIGGDGAKAIIDVLSACMSLNSLNLSSNSICDSSTEAFADGLRKLSLHELDISGNSIGDKTIEVLADALRVHTSLASLNLSDNSIGDDGAKALADVLKESIKLTSLNLSKNLIGTEGAEALATTLSAILHGKKSSDFHTLSLRQNSIGPIGAKFLADALKNCTSLHTFDINFCDICINSNLKGAMALACVLKHSRNLHTLNIAQNHLKKEGIMALAGAIKNCNKLYTFNIADNNIDDCGIQAIANSLKRCRNLHRLDVSKNKMSKSGLKALASSIKGCVELQVLDVSYNDIGKDGMKVLAGVIKCCSNLHTLNVSHISNDGSVKALADAIKGCSELHALNISNNGIKSQDTKPLADAIKQCSKMHTLDIGYNKLHCNGAETLCTALKDCSNLHILDISFNDIGNDGAKALAGVIECCSNLHSLIISCNRIYEDGTKAIQNVTKYYNNFHLESIPAVFQRRSRGPSLHDPSHHLDISK